jgi:hypothetical protein
MEDGISKEWQCLFGEQQEISLCPEITMEME